MAAYSALGQADKTRSETCFRDSRGETKHRVILFSCRSATYVWPELLDVPIEGVDNLPSGHDDDVYGEQHADDEEELRVLHHLKQTAVTVLTDTNSHI